MKIDIFNTDKKYNIIYADPPWQYRSKECLAKKSILNGELNTHYPTMSLEELKTIPIDRFSEKDSLLFMRLLRLYGINKLRIQVVIL